MLMTALPDRVSVGGTTLEVLRKGRGQPLLFLHPGHGIDPADEFLEALAGKYRVIAPAHPGFGASQLPAGVTSVDDLAYFYLDFIEQEDLHDAVLVGASFGGWLAAELAIKGTGRFSKLVLLDSVGAKFGDREQREIKEILNTPIDDLPGVLFADPKAGVKKFGDLDFPSMTEAEITRFARNRESFLMFGWAPALFNPKLAARLHRIAIPSLVMWGEDDAVVPPAYGRAFAKAIPGATFAGIPHAGHYGYMEQPQAYASAVLRFLNG
ncbi:MAG TPA: alpha/beta hydrolase [Rhizomicrobium sp.]